MKIVRTLQAEDDAEVRELVGRTLVVESAQEAGLSVAQPITEGSQACFLVYGPSAEPGAAMWARVVRLQGVGLGESGAVFAPELRPGELLALLDWSEDQDALYLLTYAQASETWRDSQLPGGWCRARPERWRRLVVESGVR